VVAPQVLGILLAEAIPTFLGTINAADDRSVQSYLATALTDAEAHDQNGGQTYYVNGSQECAGSTTRLANAQLSLTFKAGSLGGMVTQGTSGSMSVASVAVSADGSGVVLAAYSLPDACFCIVQNNAALSSVLTSVTRYFEVEPRDQDDDGGCGRISRIAGRCQPQLHTDQGRNHPGGLRCLLTQD
jgi:type II secretory pathway pseudopilin PulG